MVLKKVISESLDMCLGKIKDCEVSIVKNSNGIIQCVESLDNLTSENIALMSSVSELKKRVAAGEKYSRNNCLEISGVPEETGENITVVASI